MENGQWSYMVGYLMGLYPLDSTTETNCATVERLLLSKEHIIVKREHHEAKTKPNS